MYDSVKYYMNRKIKISLDYYEITEIKSNILLDITQKNVAKEANLSRNIIENNEKLKIAINEVKASL